MAKFEFAFLANDCRQSSRREFRTLPQWVRAVSLHCKLHELIKMRRVTFLKTTAKIQGINKVRWIGVIGIVPKECNCWQANQIENF